MSTLEIRLGFLIFATNYCRNVNVLRDMVNCRAEDKPRIFYSTEKK